MRVPLLAVCLLAAACGTTATATDPAACERYQAQLAIDRPYLGLDETLSLDSAIAEPIPIADATLVDRAVMLSTAGGHDRDPASTPRAYVNASYDVPVDDLAAWKKAHPEVTDLRLLVSLHAPDRLYSAPYSSLAAELHQKLQGGDIASLGPILVDAAAGCDAAREAVATLRHRDPDATGKAVAAALASCECRLADVETFVVTTSWLLERQIGWLPVTDSALAETAGGEIQALVDLAERGRML